MSIFTLSVDEEIMNKKFAPLFFLAIMLFFFSCKKEKANYGSDFTRGYYPLKIGRYITYEMDSTLWDDFLKVKTVKKYQVRYIVADTFRDNSKRLSYRIDVLKRTSETLPWIKHRVYYATPTDTHMEYVEENLRFIKIIFPLSNNITWDGNSMISSTDQDYTYFQGWVYSYSNLGLGFNNGKAFFDNTVMISQADETLNDPELHPDTYAYRTFGREVYAFDIGMVYREMTHWTYQPTIGYRSGYSVVLRAVDHN